MASVLWRFPLLGFILLACGHSALGGDYADPSGFSFTYPDGWVPVSRALMNDAAQDLPREAKDWISKNKVDMNRAAMFLIRNGRDEFLENLNVIVEDQQIPVNDDKVKELTSTIEQQYRASGVKIDNFQGRVQKIGANDAVVLEFQSRMPGVSGIFRQKQVAFPGGGKTYIVTCTAKADSFDKYQPVFDEMLASFQVPTPASQGFDWKQVWHTALAGGIVGGLVGGLAWVGRKFLRRG